MLNAQCAPDVLRVHVSPVRSQFVNSKLAVARPPVRLGLKIQFRINKIYAPSPIRTACRPFSIGVILMVLHEFNGCFTMTNYAGIIFSQAGSRLSPSVSSIIIGTIQFFGAYVSTILVDRLGRKVWSNNNRKFMYCIML